MADYVANFDATYVTSVRARDRRAARAARYTIQIWNQYDAAVERKAKTNNVLESWHNRFQLLIGKNHPDVFAFIREMQKEQGDTQNCYRGIVPRTEDQGCAKKCVLKYLKLVS